MKFLPDLITFTEEIFNAKLQFLCSVLWTDIFKFNPYQANVMHIETSQSICTI